MSFIRVLYGSKFDETRPKMLKDLDKSFSTEKPQWWQRFVRESITYYTMGSEATWQLKNRGAKNIVQVTDDPLPVVSGGVWTWNKMFLMKEALRDWGDIVYTDFDVGAKVQFDPATTLDLIRSHPGLGKVLQFSLIRYKKSNHYWWRGTSGKDWTRISPRIGVFGCFLYIGSLRLAECFLKDYQELSQQKKVGDEHTITYSVDKRFGQMTVKQLYEEFDPVVLQTRRSLVKGLGVEKPHAIFSHKH